MKNINSRAQFKSSFLKFLAANGQNCTTAIAAGVQTDLGSADIDRQAKDLQGCSLLYQYFLSDFLTQATPGQVWNVFGGSCMTLQAVLHDR